MNIKQLLKNVDILNVLNLKEDEDLEIKNVHYHSGKIEEDGLFVCIKGYKTDGHKFAKMAIEKGAKALIVEDVLDIDIPQYLVQNSRQALSIIGDNFYNHPSQKLKMVGITATNGKTTTSFMLNTILEEHKLKTGIIGTVFVKYGDVKIPSILTTPQSLDLHYHLNEMNKIDVSHLVMEVSSSGIELDRTYGVDFDVVTLNNISREHIDSHGSYENYIKFKTSLIKNAKKGAFAILNLDDEISKSLITETEATPFTYGIDDKSGDVFITDLDLSTGYGRYVLNYKGNKYQVELSVPGYHSVYNSLVAISSAIVLDIPMESIIEGIKKFKGIERRFELIYDYDFKIVDDHFANKGNIDITLKTLEFMDFNKFHLVYAIRGSRGYTVNKENAETIVHWLKQYGIDKIIATKSIGHVSEKDVVTEEEEKVFLDIMKENDIEVNLYNTIEEATSEVLNKVRDEDVILLAGCQGMDYGCNIILNQLEKIKDIPVEELKKPLENRVAGLLDE